MKNWGEFLIYEATVGISFLASLSSISGEIHSIHVKFLYIVIWIFHQKVLGGEKRGSKVLSSLSNSTLVIVQSND